MFLVGLLSWWYGDGWRARVTEMFRRMSTMSDYFSISLLLGTLFAPFRQISASANGSTMGDQMRAFFDKTLSRVIGAIVRIGMIIIGIIVLILVLIINVIVLIVWPIVPLLPALGLIMSLIGWVPSWR